MVHDDSCLEEFEESNQSSENSTVPDFILNDAAGLEAPAKAVMLRNTMGKRDPKDSRQMLS